MTLNTGRSESQLAARTKKKIVATTGKNRRPFFSPATLTTRLKNASTTASTTFWAPRGTSSQRRVARKTTMIIVRTTSHEVSMVFVTSIGPTLKRAKYQAIVSRLKARGIIVSTIAPGDCEDYHKVRV